MRLIDADALMGVLKEKHDRVIQDPEVSNSVKWGEAVCHHRAMEAIEKSPTVDAVEVVRCKDCKHYEWNLFDGCHVCIRLSKYVKEDFFCSYGEKRNEHET